MNISQKCNCCAKEEVCKFTEEYQADCKRLVQNISGRSTEINIKCKYFSNKSTSTTRNLENENE